MSILHLMSARAVLLFVSLALITVSNGFQVQKNSPHSPSSRLFLAGFGASSGGGGKKAKKSVAPIKLRPKQQWDRYSELKREEKVQVAIRLTADEGECTDWLEVGRVKSRENKFPELAVALQRAIIAEVCRNLLFPSLPNFCSRFTFQFLARKAVISVAGIQINGM